MCVLLLLLLCVCVCVCVCVSCCIVSSTDALSNSICSRICDADEVVLFERATFLVIAHAQATSEDASDNEDEDNGNPAEYNNEQQIQHIHRTPHYDTHRFEKISNIVKQFKLSCGKAQSQFQGMEVRNSRFAAYIDFFTTNTVVMVIVSNPQVHTQATILNIKNARDLFEKFIPKI